MEEGCEPAHGICRSWTKANQCARRQEGSKKLEVRLGRRAPVGASGKNVRALGRQCIGIGTLLPRPARSQWSRRRVRRGEAEHRHRDIVKDSARDGCSKSLTDGITIGTLRTVFCP